MSRFLAPIHTWLFNKIRVFESIEVEVIVRYKLATGKDISEIVSANRAKFGDLLPELPLEEMIDQGNIHGWLQEKINVVEARQAGIITALVANEDGDLHDSIGEAYKSVALKAAAELAEQVKNPDASEIYNLLNNYVLEGMPCDRVNAMISQDADKVAWETTSCLHKKYWDAVDGDIENYYALRTIFSYTFAQGLNKNYRYKFENENKMLHEIYKI